MWDCLDHDSLKRVAVQTCEKNINVLNPYKVTVCLFYGQCKVREKITSMKNKLNKANEKPKECLFDLVNVELFPQHFRLMFSFSFDFSDQEASSQPHKTAHERVHGVVSVGATQDCRGEPGQTQRGDLQGIGPSLEAALPG